MQMRLNSSTNFFGNKFKNAINKVFTNTINFYDKQTHSKYEIREGYIFMILL